MAEPAASADASPETPAAAAAEVPDDVPVEAPDEVSAQAPEEVSGEVSDDMHERVSRDERFRHTDEGIDWACAVCETWNPIERTTCAACGAPFARALGAEDSSEDVDVPETQALLMTALLPGAGHWMAGRRGAGISRAFVYVVWLVGGFLLLRGAVGSSESVLPAAALLVGAIIVWGTAQYDTLVVVRGGDTDHELLRPRIFLWLVVAVIGALILAFVTATMRLPSAGS